MLLYALALPCSSSSSSTLLLSSHFLFSRLLRLLSALMAPLSINAPSPFKRTGRHVATAIRVPTSRLVSFAAV